MTPLTVAEAARLLGVPPPEPAAGDRRIGSVVADSRVVGPGSLFVALPGTRVDGHDYVPGATAAGAVASLTRRPVDGCPCLVVDDPLTALGRLARHVADTAAAAGMVTVAITGSQGKTSTKDLLGQLLSAAGPTVAPAGNLNNELGLPLTVSTVTEETRFLVAEMGARGVGHIAYLCRICPPRVGVVLGVGHAHVGEFGSREAIARAKGELPAALPPDGVAVLNADDHRVWGMRDRTAARIVGFSLLGPPPGADGVWASDLTGDDRGRWRFVLHRRDDGQLDPPQSVALPLVGRHQVSNALAAAAVATWSGIDLPTAAAGLQRVGLRSRWRMEVTERPDGVLVVNDAYNASPEAMRSAVETVASMARARGARSCAVLGDMLELGDLAEPAHAEVGRLVTAQGFGRLVAVGGYAATVAAAARAAGMDPAAVTAVADGPGAVRAVADWLVAGDVVLVKASRGLALDTVAAALVGSGPAAGGEATTGDEAVGSG